MSSYIPSGFRDTLIASSCIRKAFLSSFFKLSRRTHTNSSITLYYVRTKAER